MRPKGKAMRLPTGDRRASDPSGKKSEDRGIQSDFEASSRALIAAETQHLQRVAEVRWERRGFLQRLRPPRTD
jgi:hypothetical protein